MDGGTGPGAELLSPAETEWPPELRLPPPPSLTAHHGPAPQLQPKQEPPPPPRHAQGFEDQQHFLGSIMGAAAQPQPQPQQAAAAAPEALVKRKRGRPRKIPDGAAAAAAAAPARPTPATKDEEVVCFICFDGGNLVVCDRRGCPKVYHPACIKRDESFFKARVKWDCGWHICSICEKAAHYMCYTCTYSLCKGCITKGDFFAVRGNKGFCDTCYGTILLIESQDECGSKIKVDFDDKTSWEYLFKLYWLDQKGKHLLTLEELISAKSRWIVPTTAGRREKSESSDESYHANNDQDASFDISSRKRRQSNSCGRRGRKRQKDAGVTARKHEISFKGYESLPNRLPTKGMVLQGDTKWASPELLEFIGHVRNGDSSYISQHDVHILLLEYIKQNNLRDPRKRSQVICDARLNNLFRKPRVAHFEMLKLLEMHFHVKENPAVNADSNPDSAQLDSNKRRKIHKINQELTANPEDYAAIDMHNINLIYLRRSLMEDLIDDTAAFSDKIAGAFVRIRISGLGQKQDMYRLVKVLGTHKVTEQYSVGKKTTDYALEILNLDKKEIITMDTISNQDFTEEECKRLRQSMKFGLVARLKVGDIYEKAKIFQSLQFNDWLENEKQRLSHLRDRASETGRRKELRECVEKLQLLNTPEERARKINEVPEVHVDPRMAPDYESADEQYYKKAADWTINRSRSEQLFPERKGAKSNSMDNDTQKSLDASVHMSRLPMEDMANRSGTVINLKSTAVETVSLPSSGAVLSDTEPEKVWHYKDPSGNVQGPFTLLQLSKWESFFPRDIRIWLTFESEKNSLLLTEVLKQQKDYILPSAVETKDMSIGTGTGQDRTNSCLVANNSSSPVGCNVNHLSGLSSHAAEFSGLTKEGSTVLCGALPSKSTKDAHNSHGQVQHQVNYSCTIPSSTASGSHDERVPREQVGEWKNPQDIVGMWSSTASSMNCSLKSNVEPHPHPDGYSVKDKFQNGSKGNLPAGSVQSFNSRIDSGLQKVPDLTLQQSHRDPAASLSPKSPSEFMCKEEDTCCHSATNDSTHDDLQLSIGFSKHESSSLTNPVEDRDSSSASACRPQQIVYMSTTDSPKTATINWHNTSLTDASCKPFDQHSELNNDPVLSSGIHQDREHPSPTAKLERKQTSMNQSGLISVAPKDSGTKTCVHSSISFVSESSPPAGKTGSLRSLDLTSCLVERHSSDRDTTAQKEQLNGGNMSLKRKNLVINPISDAQVIAVSDVFESLTEKICEKNNLHGAVSSEGLMPASTEEEQPQCSSPIALSPWGEQNYYQGEAVDSALWGVQDDHENDMWSMHSPTPAIHPSSGLGADGKDVSGIIDDVMAAHENSTCVETLLKQGEKKMEQGNSSAFTGSGELEQVKTKTVSASGPGPSIHGTTKTADCQLSGTALEGSAKASGWKPPGLLLEEITKASDWQSSDICKESGSKASSLQPSDSSLGRGVKASAWEESNYSTEEGTRASGWQRSSSFPEGSRKGSCWQMSGSAEGNVKASGQQQSGLSPEGSRKGSCWQPSGSAEGNMKASGQQQSSLSPEGSRKVSGSQRSDSSAQGNTNASSWQPSGSSAERNAKVDGWQRTSSSPERCRKASGRHPSVRESSRANSTNEDHKPSSCHQASRPTAKNTWETPKRQGNSDKNTVIWGEALGNNRSWNPSSGNASQRSHGGYNHERYSHGSDLRRVSSNHSRRFDHRQDHDRGGGSSRWSRGQGQSPRSVCKYYESGRCYKGDKCHYLHR